MKNLTGRQPKYLAFLIGIAIVCLLTANRVVNSQGIPPARFAVQGGGGDTLKTGDLFFSQTDLRISENPFCPPDMRLKSGLGLILEKAGSQEKGRWYRILSADGHCGWIKDLKALRRMPSIEPGEVTIHDLSPDDSGFYSAEEHKYALSQNNPTVITGFSKYSRAATPFMNSIPENRNPFDLPWLRIHTDNFSGWLPPYAINFNWRILFGSTPNAYPNAISQWGLAGLSRRPFLGPVQRWIKKDYPSAEGLPVCLIQNADDKPDAISTVLLLLDSPSDLLPETETTSVLVFIDKRGQTMRRVMHSNAFVLADYEKADMDNDGLKEWMIELTYAYPDGEHSTLLVVDGQSIKRGLTTHTLDLGGTCGEPGCNNNVASFWWVDHQAGRMPLICRVLSSADSPAVAYALFFYSRVNGLKQVRTKNTTIAYVRAFDNKQKADQSCIALCLKSGHDELHVFPHNKAGHLKWLVGRIFENELEARSWILPATRRYTNVQLMPGNE